ncbi:MAG: transglycosylase domain-containing protein, partial [Armatimonadetes bacterium]|nr:transglycosylase domain-containing protein [Armatimonadota bacterium]
MAGERKIRAKARPGRGARLWRRAKIALIWTWILACVGLMSVVVVGKQRLDKAVLLVPNLPTVIENVNNRPSVIVSADGVVLYSIQAQYRRPVSIEKIPQKVIDATEAAEDKRFREHDGVDFKTMFGILAQTIREGEVPRGGSTLTMQMAKRLYTSTDRTMDRKLDDMALAMMIERSLTKDQIIELYLNQIYYGELAYGIGAAADVYFGKTDLYDLTIAEAALLARLVRRPSDENPFKNPKVAKRNRNLVLKLMWDQGKINEEEYDEAIAEKLTLAERRPQTVSGRKDAPYFVDYVLRFLKKNHPDIDLTRGGYRIETTINSELQKFAETTIDEAVEELAGQRVTTAAMMLIGFDGKILVHVGGSDYGRNQYDVLTQGRRQ